MARLPTYYDNQVAIDAELDRISREAAKARTDSLDSPLRQRLRATGKLG